VKQDTIIPARWLRPKFAPTKPIDDDCVKRVVTPHSGIYRLAADRTSLEIFFCYETQEEVMVFGSESGAPRPIPIDQAFFCPERRCLLGVVLHDTQLIVRNEILSDVVTTDFEIKPPTFLRLFVVHRVP